MRFDQGMNITEHERIEIMLDIEHALLKALVRLPNGMEVITSYFEEVFYTLVESDFMEDTDRRDLVH